ncbi:MAG: hypothetical protein AVDCRST_MAG25-3471, partial [uncultured Rubrobacteraceae bacterium]
AERQSPGVQPGPAPRERPRDDPGGALLAENLLRELSGRWSPEGAGRVRAARRDGHRRTRGRRGPGLERADRGGGRGRPQGGGRGGAPVRGALAGRRRGGGGGVPALDQNVRRQGRRLPAGLPHHGLRLRRLRVRLGSRARLHRHLLCPPGPDGHSHQRGLRGLFPDGRHRGARRVHPGRLRARLDHRRGPDFL